MGLTHVSTGVGNTRYIQVGKPERGEFEKRADASKKGVVVKEVKPSDPQKTPQEAVVGTRHKGEAVGNVEAAELAELGTVPTLAATGTSDDNDEGGSSGSTESDECHIRMPLLNGTVRVKQLWLASGIKQLWLASVPFREGFFFFVNAVDGCSP